MENLEKERHASWLENFYDLIVAIVVFQLSSILNHNVSVSGFLAFIALFIPVFWSWIGVTFYNTRFETDDVGHRLLTLLQMAAAAFMAVCVSDGLGKYSSGFALSYVPSTIPSPEVETKGSRVCPKIICLDEIDKKPPNSRSFSTS
jgi:low temperature requirement protein LtrA